MTKFRTSFTLLLDINATTCLRSVRVEENIAAVSAVSVSMKIVTCQFDAVVGNGLMLFNHQKDFKKGLRYESKIKLMQELKSS